MFGCFLTMDMMLHPSATTIPRVMGYAVVQRSDHMHSLCYTLTHKKHEDDRSLLVRGICGGNIEHEKVLPVVRIEYEKCNKQSSRIGLILLADLFSCSFLQALLSVFC